MPAMFNNPGREAGETSGVDQVDLTAGRKLNDPPPSASGRSPTRDRDVNEGILTPQQAAARVMAEAREEVAANEAEVAAQAAERRKRAKAEKAATAAAALAAAARPTPAAVAATAAGSTAAGHSAAGVTQQTQQAQHSQVRQPQQQQQQPPGPKQLPENFAKMSSCMLQLLVKANPHATDPTWFEPIVDVLYASG
jgi:hypothetical protein